MRSIKVKQSYNLTISGKPSYSVESLPSPNQVAVLPSTIAHIKPKALVKEGDKVRIGSLLFLDKLLPEVAYRSPGAGTVSRITYGPRRRLDEIVIDLDADESSESLDAISPSQLNSVDRDTLVKTLVNSGTWPFLRRFPFKKVADPAITPPAIYVTLDNDEPFLPQSDVYLKDRIDTLKFGLDILKKLSDHVYVGAAASNSFIRKELHQYLTHTIEGDYPANNPGVFHYHAKPNASHNSAWFIHGQDVLLIAEALEKGHYPTQRLVVLAGSMAKNRVHLQTRLGVPFSTLSGTSVPSTPTRYVGGGVLTGRRADHTSFLGLYETALHLLPEGKEPEMMSFMKLGANKASYSSTFLSKLFPAKALSMDTSINGGHRACVACSACPEVCPVELYPQFIMRDLEAGDIENAIHQGLLDCADCGLCTYVCPSKIELNGLFDKAKAQLAKDVA